jgi:hypothetical protein
MFKATKSKSKDAAAAPAPSATFPKSVAELNARVALLRAEHDAATTEIIQLEGAGVTVPETFEVPPREAAIALLQGEQPEALAPVLDGLQARLVALHRKQKVLSEAMKLASDREMGLQANEAAERYYEHKDEWHAAVREVALTLLQLERNLQEMDRVHRIVRPIHPLQFFAWPLLGRLKERGGPLYRYVQVAANEGILDQEVFKQALRHADEARPK